MRWLLRFYPRWWRDRYGDEFAALLDDLPEASRLDVVRGLADAWLRPRPRPRLTGPVRLGVLLGLPGALALAADVVYANVIRPGGDDSVLGWYAAIFALQFVAGLVAARRTRPPFGPALAAATTGVVIGVLVIVTFAVVDNLFLGTVGSQPQKIRGLAESPFTSMRLYVNASLVLGAAILIPVLSTCGLVLGEAGRRVSR
jgi:hypothetical protein